MKKQTQKKKKQQKTNDVKWFVLRGFNKQDEDKVGFLALDDDNHKYSIVDSISEALKLPSKNVNNVSSFGTPEQWFDFFKNDDALSDWKFHLMKIRSPRR